MSPLPWRPSLAVFGGGWILPPRRRPSCTCVCGVYVGVCETYEGGPSLLFIHSSTPPPPHLPAVAGLLLPGAFVGRLGPASLFFEQGFLEGADCNCGERERGVGRVGGWVQRTRRGDLPRAGAPPPPPPASSSWLSAMASWRLLVPVWCRWVVMWAWCGLVVRFMSDECFDAFF